MVRVTVSGHPGSGTSTLVANLCTAKGWSSVNGGEIFRQEASARNISLENFSQLCLSDPEVDRDLDRLLQDRMTSPDGPDVVESRLAGWWAHNLELECLRVWVEVSADERARRVVSREGGTMQDQRDKGDARMASDAARYAKLYDIDIQSREPYDCIIHSDDLSIDDVLNAVLTRLEENT